MPTAAILSGGKARRFGGCTKAFLPIGGKSIIEHILETVRSITDDILIVTRDGPLYEALGVPVYQDLLLEAGPLGAIYTALNASHTPQTLVLAADMPFLSVSFLEYVLNAGRDVDIAIPRTRDGHQPLCASYSSTCISAIERCLSEKTLKATALLSETNVRELGPQEIEPFNPHGTLCFNVNTPADYARALTLAATQTAELIRKSTLDDSSHSYFT